MDHVENKRAAAATTSNTAIDAVIDGKLDFKNNALFINCISKCINWQCRRFTCCDANVQFA